MADYLQAVKTLVERQKLLPSKQTKIKHVKTNNNAAHALTFEIDDYDEVFEPGQSNNSFSRLSPGGQRLLQPGAQWLQPHGCQGHGKRLLSVTRSMPISPTIVSDDTRNKHLYDLKVKLDRVTSELMAMRVSDQELARKLLQVNSEISILKVKTSCINHSELLDEAIYEAEKADELPDMCDAPRKTMSKLLLQRGVTRLNICARRFSCS